jgi:hypothetical protein
MPDEASEPRRVMLYKGEIEVHGGPLREGERVHLVRADGPREGDTYAEGIVQRHADDGLLWLHADPPPEPWLVDVSAELGAPDSVPSRMQTVEELKRGEQVAIDLDEFARLDNGKCGCAICLTLRQAIAEGHRGVVSLAVPPELRDQLQ